MGEMARKVLALGNACLAGGLTSALALQSPYMVHVSMMVVLHLAVCYGFLRARGWCPWAVGILASMGLVFSSMTVYAVVAMFGKALEAYLLITGLSASIGLLLASLAYAIYRREEFSS